VLTVLLIVMITVVMRDAPWRWVARVVSSVLHRLRRPGDANDLGDRLIEERDLMRGALRDRASFVMLLVLAQPLADYVVLYLAMRAVGADVNPAAALAAFIVSNLAGLIPLTPGGLGFVEAGLSGVLIVAGAARPEAHLAVVTYRLAATWVPCIAGAIALAMFHHRHRQRAATPGMFSTQ
jgi:uncharacterized protein (TIRG00374 family)